MGSELDAADFVSVSKARIFRTMSPPELRQLLATSRVVHEPAGKVLVEEGRPSKQIFLILSGSVEFYLPGGGGSTTRPTNVTLNTLGPGECFGEYSAMDDGRPSASGVAVTASRLCVWDGKDFFSAIDASDRLGRIVYGNIARLLVNRLRRKDEELDLPLL